jgi:hypothetical protein
MRILKIFCWGLVALFILIQFIPVTKPETLEVNENDLFQDSMIGEEAGSILKTSCYDCHSNETRYPWYSNIAPVKWLIIRDVSNGREELNFSNWKSLNIKDKIKLLDKIAEEVDENSMPLPIYTLIHRDATLNEESRKTLIDWTEQMTNDMLGE